MAGSDAMLTAPFLVTHVTQHIKRLVQVSPDILGETLKGIDLVSSGMFEFGGKDRSSNQEEV